jgi:hypothetical protein
MKAKPVALFASIALNAALLVLVAWPRTSSNTALAQQYGQVSGSFAAVSSKGGGNQDATWIAERVSGALVVYQYQLGATSNPILLVGTRDLKADLNERQIGNLMLIPANISDSRGVVYVLDTDSQRMAAYEYNRSDKTVSGIQRIDLRTDIQSAAGTATTGGGAPGD